MGRAGSEVCFESQQNRSRGASRVESFRCRATILVLHRLVVQHCQAPPAQPTVATENETIYNHMGLGWSSAEHAGNMQIVLDVIDGPHRGQSFTFDGHDNFIVGRARCAHFRLPKKDRYFSRIHFMVEINPPHCRLVDMGSTNGTRVNGQRVEVADLRHGDLIRGGDTVLSVSFIPEPNMELPESSKTPVAPPMLGARAAGSLESTESCHRGQSETGAKLPGPGAWTDRAFPGD